MVGPVSKSRQRIGLCVAVGLDAAQIVLFPLFGEGFASPASDVLDGLAFIFFWRLLGWHIALLPSFLIKIIPVIDLAPTWTIAVFIATRAHPGTLPVTGPPPLPVTRTTPVQPPAKIEDGSAGNP